MGKSKANMERDKHYTLGVYDDEDQLVAAVKDLRGNGVKK